MKESVLVAHTIDFLATRVFAPEAVQRLRGELEEASVPAADDPALVLTRLQDRASELERLIKRQVGVFEKYDDPEHPVVVAAEKRIGELHTRNARACRLTWAGLRRNWPGRRRRHQLIWQRF